MKTEHERIEWRSTEYEKLVDLRDRLFRRPFDLSYSAEELDGELNDIALATRIDEQPIGFLSLRRVDDSVVQLRQMVIEPEFQGQGFGSDLVEFAEQVAKSEGYTRIVLDAREESLEFYNKNGYLPMGEKFFYKTVMHQKMYKDICG